MVKQSSQKTVIKRFLVHNFMNTVSLVVIASCLLMNLGLEKERKKIFHVRKAWHSNDYA